MTVKLEGFLNEGRQQGPRPAVMAGIEGKDVFFEAPPGDSGNVPVKHYQATLGFSRDLNRSKVKLNIA